MNKEKQSDKWRFKEIINLIKSKAFWRYDNSKYHVKTSESWLHSDQYLNTDYIVSDVLLVESIVRDVFVNELNIKWVRPDWIVSYPPFGLAIAYEFARQLWVKYWYVDIKNEICTFDINKNNKVIVIWDDIYSGKSIEDTIKIINWLWATVMEPIFTIWNFSGQEDILGLEIISALSEKGNLYKEHSCPMCKIWSKAVLPRPNWKLLTNQKNHL